MLQGLLHRQETIKIGSLSLSGIKRRGKDLLMLLPTRDLLQRHLLLLQQYPQILPIL